MLTAVLICQIYSPQLQKMAAEFTRKRTQGSSQKETLTDETTRGYGALPERYDSRDVGRAPAVKNQGNLGTCWALAATSALEAALLPEETWSFSADHMSMQNGYEKNQNDGGAYPMAMAYLASWTGPVTEADDPYGDGYSPEDLQAVKHVQEMHLLKSASPDEIKQEIYKYGAVQASVYVDPNTGMTNSPWYDKTEASYCYRGEASANHDILVIGWDDAFPAQVFAGEVSENGAWICQNSWGENFGEDGIFYVSYEDSRIAETCVSYANIQDTDNYSRIYQTDLCGWVGQIGYGTEDCYFANVYTAKDDEELSAVGFYATGKDTSYEVYTAVPFEDTTSLVVWDAARTGHVEQAGYYTIDLEEPVELLAGTTFAVIVKITTADAGYPVAAEYQADENTAGLDISDGQGYVSQYGYSWTRTEDAYGCNVCLKAYTKLLEEE